MGEINHFEWVSRLVGGGVSIPPDTASANMIGRVVTAAVSRGANRPRLMEAVGITEATIRNQLSRVPGQVLIRLFSAAENETGNPAIALDIGHDSRPSCFSDIGFATRLLPNLASIVNANVQMQELRQNMYRVGWNEEGDAWVLSWNTRGYAPEMIAATIEFSMATYIRLAVEIWGRHLDILSISMRHGPRFDPQIYEKALGFPVNFGARENEVRFSREQCLAASPFANADLLMAATRSHQLPVLWFDEGKKVSAFSYFYVFTEMNKSPVTLDRIARSFGMSERTLRRQLVEEGHPFRELLDTARKSLCDLYRLENKRSLGEVAELLGYGELSAFTRAYRRWYGRPPSLNWKC